MVSCSFRACRSSDAVYKKKTTSGVTFHRFPQNAKRRDIWRQFVNRGAWRPSKNSVICSKHFPEEYIDRTSKCYVRLRENAIPSILPSNHHAQTLAQTYQEKHLSITSSGRSVGPSATSSDIFVQNFETSTSTSQNNATGIPSRMSEICELVIKEEIVVCKEEISSEGKDHWKYEENSCRIKKEKTWTDENLDVMKDN